MIQDTRKRACCRQCLINLQEYGKQLTALNHWPHYARIDMEDFEAYKAGKIINEYDQEQKRWYWKDRESGFFTY